MGIIAKRRRQRQAARLRKTLAGLVSTLCIAAVLACSPPIRQMIVDGDIQTFSSSTQQEMTLAQYDVYALQLAVFDSGERAANELARLQNEGVRCAIWQRERMRIVADAAFEREGLNEDAAKGHDAYVIKDTLEAVSLRLSADALSVEQARRLLEAPDALLKAILLENEVPMDQIASRAASIAEEALQLNAENALYTQLAQSLLNWSALMDKTIGTSGDAGARSYGAVTMCTLCRQLRQALSTLSTASAQRTPSTAADVMPPA